jgi:hypothetical protein
MRETGKLGRKELPGPIAVGDLQKLLGTSWASCSWEATHPTLSELTARWPFLFSRSFMGTSQKKPA